MHLFLGEFLNNKLWIKDRNELEHCIRVTRHKTGDIVLVTQFTGTIWKARIDTIESSFIQLDLIEEYSKEDKVFKVHIGISLTQQGDRFEWFLEKATESGVDEITPIICTRTANTKNKMDRWQKILLSSAKQCLRPSLPQLNESCSFKEIVKTSKTTQRYICHCEDSSIPYLGSMIDIKSNVIILIGPEGDFTKDEIQLAATNGFVEANLGPERLRVETAGITANIICQTIKCLK